MKIDIMGAEKPCGMSAESWEPKVQLICKAKMADSGNCW